MAVFWADVQEAGGCSLGGLDRGVGHHPDEPREVIDAEPVSERVKRCRVGLCLRRERECENKVEGEPVSSGERRGALVVHR